MPNNALTTGSSTSTSEKKTVTIENPKTLSEVAPSSSNNDANQAAVNSGLTSFKLPPLGKSNRSLDDAIAHYSNPAFMNYTTSLPGGMCPCPCVSVILITVQ